MIYMIVMSYFEEDMDDCVYNVHDNIISTKKSLFNDCKKCMQ